MKEEPIIRVKNLTKKYNLYKYPADMLKEIFHPLRKKYHREFYALNDVSFEIEKGETVGIIGRNGAGKSTLLKILTGVVSPTSGSVEIKGRISSLLELGAGFNPEMTGVENVYMNGVLLGLSKEDMDERIDSILAFADIGDFSYQPVKMYSSGMFARLAFASAINVDPEILIVDEALSVGDVRFQQRCYRKFRELKDKGITVLFVTHDTGTIVNFCSHAIWLNGGMKYDEGRPEKVCKRYLAEMAYDQETVKAEPTDKENQSCSAQWVMAGNFESFGDKKVIIEKIMLSDVNSNVINTFRGGEETVLKVVMRSIKSVNNIICGFVVNDHLGNAIFGANTHTHSELRPEFEQDKDYIVSYKFVMPMIKNGLYTISVAVAEGSQSEHIQHHWIHDIFSFSIVSGDIKASMGMLIRDAGFSIAVTDI